MLPAHRLTVYTHRREDPSETSVLTPRSGSGHTAPFKVASVSGVTGFMPYLDGIRGRRASLDPLTKVTDTGELTFRVLDKRLGSDNALRTITAYLGDASGRERIKGCLVKVEESLDGGTTWTPFFTGRIHSIRLSGLTTFEMVVRDLGQELESAEVFVGPVHSSVAYATLPNLLPSDGLAIPFGGVAPVAPLRGKIVSSHRMLTAVAGKGFIDLQNNNWRRRVFLSALQDVFATRAAWEASRVVVVSPAGTELGHLKLSFATTSDPELETWGVSYSSERTDTAKPSLLLALGVQPLPVSDPNYMPLPSGEFLWYLKAAGAKPTSKTPLLLNDVHPVQLWVDLLDGKFGYMGVDGEPTRKIPYAGFEDLLADDSLPRLRFMLEESFKLNEFIEEQICKPLNLAYTFDAQGRVVPLDLRLKKIPAVTSSITESDLVETGPIGWQMDEATTITRVEFTYYEDRPTPGDDAKHSAEVHPTNSTSHLTPAEVLYIPADLRAEADLGAKTFKIDALGFRTLPEEYLPGTTQKRAPWLESFLDRTADEIQGPFGTGAMYTTLPCSRTGGASDCYPGDWRILNVPFAPNPASNRRGGSRIGLCVERVEEGPTIHLTFLDAGPDSVAVAPTLGTATVSLGPPPAVVVPVTLNAAGDDAIVEYAVVNAGAARPADGSRLWTRAARTNVSRNVTILGVPYNKRVWIRAHSRSGTSDLRLPSPFVYSAAISTSTLAAPSNLAVAYIARTVARVSFTPGNVELPTQVYLYQGAANPTTWEAHYYVQTLFPGSTEVLLEGLEGPGESYRVALRHLDARGQPGPFATVGIMTVDVASQAPRPAGIALALY